jgi:hypothetical protein
MRTVHTELLEIAFDEGGPENGPPVLLLHGRPDAQSRPGFTQKACIRSHRIFEALEAHFTAGYQRVLLDSVGYLPHREAPVDVTATILRHLGI